MTRRLLPYGERGLLLECEDLTETVGVLRALQQLDRDDLTEIVPGARTIFLRSAQPLSRKRQRELLDLEPISPDRRDTAAVEIGVHYDGADLTEVAEILDLTTDEVIAAHTGQILDGRLLRLRPRLRLPARPEPHPASAPTDPPADLGPRRSRRLGRRVVGHLPQPGTRGLAADRAHHPGPLGPGSDPAGPAAARHDGPVRRREPLTCWSSTVRDLRRCCRIWAAAAMPSSVSPRRGRPTGRHSGWPTGWSATPRVRPPSSACSAASR